MTSISDKNCDIYYFAIKDTHWSLPTIDNICKSSVIMEMFLNILEAPRPQQEDNCDEEKTRFISSKISIWNFLGIPQATYLNYTVEEESKMFRDCYSKLCEKVQHVKIIFLSRLFCLVSFLACSLIFSLIFFWPYF